jgi:hypothetical protein
MDQNENYLDILSIFHYVVAGLVALFACIPFLHVFIGLFMIIGGCVSRSAEGCIPVFIGLIFIVIAGTVILCGWTLAFCIFIAGRNLKKRKHYMYCLVIAGLSCLFMPFGTVLGVFTIIVLTRPGVKEQLFGVEKKIKA